MFFAAAYTHVARGTNTLLKFATRLARIMLEFIIQSLIVGVRLHRKQFIKGGPWQQRVLVLFFTWWYYGSTIIEPSYLSTRKTLMCFSCNKAWSLLRSDTCGFLLVLCWYYRHTNTDTHTHTHTYNTLRDQQNDAPLQIYIYITFYVLSYLYYIKLIIH